MAEELYMESDPEGGYTADDSEAEILLWLQEQTASDTQDGPYTLTVEQLVRIIRESEIPDAAGRLPGAALWVPSWDRNRAASKAWDLIASKLATSTTSMNPDGDRQPNDYRYLNAKRQAEMYEARRPAPWLA